MHLPKKMDPETLALVQAALPASVKEFARIIGLEAALALVRDFGGMEIRFPKSANGCQGTRFAEIADVIGQDNARRLAAELDHEAVFIPFCHKAVTLLRNRAMVEDFERLTEGQSGRQVVGRLVRKYRLTYRQVEKIIGRPVTA